MNIWDWRSRMTHKFPFQIAYADTDAGGIVYHARYIEIAERARMNWFSGDCVPKNDDIGFIVTGLSAKYMKPLRLADKIIVESEFIRASGVRATVEQKFVLDGTVAAVVQINLAYLGGDMRPKRIPAEFIVISDK